MDAVLRGAFIYLFVLLITRISGKRTFAQLTPFDFILILIISEALQQAMIGEDYSLTNAVIVVTTLVGLDIILSLFTQKSKSIEKWIDGTPLILIEDGEMLKERMDKERVDETDILEAARRLRGIERLDQIKYAVLEKSGGITVIAKESEGDRAA